MNKYCCFKKSIIFVCIFLIVSMPCAFCENLAANLNVFPTVTDNELCVLIEYTSSDMCGGSFNFIYNTEVLRLVAVEDGEAIKNTTHFINQEYADGTIRVNWVSTTAMPLYGSLVSIKFEMLNETFDKSYISIDKLKVANSDGNKIKAEYNIAYDLLGQTSAPTQNSSGNNYSSGVNHSSAGSVIKQESEKGNSQTTNLFADVQLNDWFYSSVRYVVENKLMNGMSKTEFAPNNTLTRAMLVTVLYRNCGEPSTNKSITFADVDMEAYYANAVSWAKQNGIVNGITENEFAPDSNITREQIAAIMHRFAQYKGYDVSIGENTSISSYTDAGSVSDYARASMQYVVGSGLIKGKSHETLNPQDNATRAEIAAILQRFIEANN